MRRRLGKLALAVGGAALVTAVSGGAASAAGGSIWPQVGYNAAHTNVNPFERTLSTATVPGLRHVWSNQTGTDAPTDPVVADGKVFETSFHSSAIRAISAASGARVWTFIGPGRLIAPVVAHGTVFTSAGRTLYALNEDTGALRWSAPMLATGGLVYSRGVLYTEPINPAGRVAMGAYSATTGARLWTANVGSLLALPAVGAHEVFAVDNNSRALIALSAADGHVLWTRRIGEQSNASPVVSGRSVFVTTFFAHMLSIDTTTGAVRWRRTLSRNGGGTEYPPAAYRGRLYEIIENPAAPGCRDQTTLTVRSMATGRQVWSRIFENISCADALVGGGGPRTPAIANGLVYLPEMNAKKIRVFTTGGRLVTAVPVDEFVMSTVVVASGKAFVSTWDPEVAPSGTAHVEAFGL